MACSVFPLPQCPEDDKKHCSINWSRLGGVLGYNLEVHCRTKLGDGPNTVRESTVSNMGLSEFLALTEFRGENSVSSSPPRVCVPSSQATSPIFWTTRAVGVSEALPESMRTSHGLSHRHPRDESE